MKFLFKTRWLLTILIGVSQSATFALDIPKGLTQSDRQEVLNLFGLNTSSKLLTDPYALGGYSGLEIGVALEIIDTRSLANLGAKNTKNEDQFIYPRITVGKGLYDDLDIFFHFIPPTPGTQVSQYGAMARWSFYQFKFVPISVSAVLSGSQINVQDSLVNQSYGLDLVAGISMNDLSIYFGAGNVKVEGEFMGGTTGDGVVPPNDPALITSVTNTVRESISEIHTVIGISAHFDNLFAAAQIDHYRDQVISTKLGVRF